ncbi:MAG: hypothetical protein GY804_04620 [Alphaproteobacteria bacterium]|nr:hypothetical protein [Alphaproteobacteria bacterium]
MVVPETKGLSTIFCTSCNDDTEMTCTCSKQTSIIVLFRSELEETEEAPIIDKPKKKKHMSRMEKAKMYGGGK